MVLSHREKSDAHCSHNKFSRKAGITHVHYWPCGFSESSRVTFSQTCATPALCRSLISHFTSISRFHFIPKQLFENFWLKTAQCLAFGCRGGFIASDSGQCWAWIILFLGDRGGGVFSWKHHQSSSPQQCEQPCQEPRSCCPHDSEKPLSLIETAAGIIPAPRGTMSTFQCW